jgi:hypothetical protein
MKKTVNITERAVMIALDFKKLGNSKRLSDGQFEVEADKAMVRASKKLLDSAELKAISHVDSGVRAFLKIRALPSLFKGGFYLIPIPLVEEVEARLTEFAKLRKERVETFVEAYPELMKEAKKLLKGVFSGSDYLTPDDVRAQFGFEWRYINFGVPAQLAKIREELYAKEKDKAAKHWAQATSEMTTLLRANMAELVEHMNDRLEPGEDGKPKTFKASTIDNLNDFLKNFDARNITDDKELKSVVMKARALVKGIDADKLRSNEELRAKMKTGMKGLRKQLDKLVVIKGKRKIRFAEDGSGAKAPAAGEGGAE